MNNPTKINVLFIASEADPLIKVGGLGDVAGSLPRALRAVSSTSDMLQAELDVKLVIPFHPAINKEQYPVQLVTEYQVHSNNGDLLAKAFFLELDGLPIYLISGDPIDKESGVYSSNLESDGYKYVFFSQAALNLVKRMDWKPDILHANDWHTSPAIYSLAINRPLDPFFRQTMSMLTVHNLPYLGAMTSTALAAFDLPSAENTSLPTWAGHMALPLGLLTADVIVAVSPGYAKEIMTEEFGSGLQTFLRVHSGKITGILNGLDTNKWDPATDTNLISNFSHASLHLRSKNKEFLQNELGMEQGPDLPLLAMVSRMDPQKGVDLAVDSIRLLLQSNLLGPFPIQVIFLGKGDPFIENAAYRLQHDYPKNVQALITYDERISRHIYAGADMLLMPSRYEPCGLSQMIAMRYGCLPLARTTGGLADTIQDQKDLNLNTGFLFKSVTPDALAETILRALKIFKGNPQVWQAMQIRAMQQDFSWDRSAKEYLKQYKTLLDKRDKFNGEYRKYV